MLIILLTVIHIFTITLSLTRIGLEKHVLRAQLSWSTATEKDLNSYRNNLIQNLNTIPIPIPFCVIT